MKLALLLEAKNEEERNLLAVLAEHAPRFEARVLDVHGDWEEGVAVIALKVPGTAKSHSVPPGQDWLCVAGAVKDVALSMASDWLMHERMEMGDVPVHFVDELPVYTPLAEREVGVQEPVEG